MKPVLKIASIFLLIAVLVHISCKKEYSCENCGSNSSTNKPPIANAGLDQIITLPTDSVLLDGKNSSDPDGRITQWLWKKISGPASLNILRSSDSATVVKNLATGTYLFELKVTDNGRLSASDTMKVIVDSVLTINHPPVANAGTDQTITLPTNTVNLDGSGSTDPDNNIVSYVWTKISGPALFNIANASAVQTQATNLLQGVYLFELNVTDAGALFSKDTMQVIVNAGNPNNIPPVARAGNDTTIQSNQTSCTPVSVSIALNGSNSYDPDGTIVNYLWSGPGVIANPNVATTTVSGLMPGINSFILKVTDNNGASAYDTIQITVLPANRPLIPAQLIPETTIPSGTYAGTIGNKLLFLFVDCGNHCDDTAKSLAYFNIYDRVTQAWSISSNYLITPRDIITFVTIGNKIICAGGFNGDGTTYQTNLSDVDIYDLSTNTWSATSLSARKCGMAAVAINNKVFFGGGNEQTGPNSYFATNKVEVYDLSANLWSIITLSEARVHLSAVTLGNKIYFAGGINNLNSVSKKVDVYDDASNSWSTFDLQEPKAAMSAIIVNNKIYWAAGADENRPGPNNSYSWVLTSQVEIKDINTGNSTITCLFQPNVWVWQNAAVQKNDHIVFFTGGNYYAVKNKFDIYNTSTQSWSIGVLPQNIEGTIISINNTIYVSSGSQVWKLEF